jgi:predicted GIY-YIG superfamily endonuclease
MNPRYKKMLAGMLAKEATSATKPRERWFLYILKCGNQSLYTGIAKDVERRFRMHQNGKGAYYTRMYQPLEVVYQERCKSRTEALVRECAVKALPRSKKLALIETFRKRSNAKKKRRRAKPNFTKSSPVPLATLASGNQ